MIELVEKLRSCFFGCSYKGFAGQKPIGERRGGGGDKIPYPLAPSPVSCFFFPLIDQQGSYFLNKIFYNSNSSSMLLSTQLS